MENTTTEDKPFSPDNLRIVLKTMQNNFPDKDHFWAFLNAPKYRQTLLGAVNRSLSDPRQARAALLKFNLLLDLIQATHHWEQATIDDLPPFKQNYWQTIYYQLLNEDPELIPFIFPKPDLKERK